MRGGWSGRATGPSDGGCLDWRSSGRVALLLALGVAAAAARPVWADDGDAPRPEPVARGADPVERWRSVVAIYDWDADVALAIVRCESRGDPGAVNASSGATGLFQVMPRWQALANALHGRWVSLRDPSANTRVAYELYATFGWHPWDASLACWRAD
jgi:soluble lytic murein transglycosylase-like protein